MTSSTLLYLSWTGGGVHKNLIMFGLGSPRPTPQKEISALFLCLVDYAEQYTHIGVKGYHDNPCFLILVHLVISRHIKQTSCQPSTYIVAMAGYPSPFYMSGPR